MNSRLFSDAMGEIDTRYIDQVLAFRPVVRRHPFRRMPAALIAAVLALLLMGAGISAAILYGDSIKSWFVYHWNEITGQSMDQGQIAVIDHLSQEIGISQTVGNVTVTVDSAAVGDDNFYLLLKVEGIQTSSDHSYDFLQWTVEATPDPLADDFAVGWYAEYLGISQNGAALLLFTYRYLGESGFTPDTRPLQIHLGVQNLAQDAHTDQETILAEGEWNFTFTIDRSQTMETITLPDTEVMATDVNRQEQVAVTLTQIELTSTGLRFQYPHSSRSLFLSGQKVAAVLKDGSAVGTNGGMGSLSQDGADLCCVYQWTVPVDLDQVAAIQIGDTQIDVP